MEVTELLRDNNNVLRETDDLGTLAAQYTYQPQPYGDLVSQHRDSESSFYRFDALGSTTSLTDPSGKSNPDFRTLQRRFMLFSSVADESYGKLRARSGGDL